MLKRFRQPEERTAFAKVLDRAAFCAKNHEPAFSEFLDAYHAQAFWNALGDGAADGLHVRLFGGYEDAERKMLGFWQDYMEPSNEDFPIAAVRLTYDEKFADGLTHRDFLGAALGVGITRAMLGDVAMMPGRTIVFAHADIADYLCGALDKVARLRVSADICPPEALYVFAIDRPRTRMTVASLRLDVVAGAVFHLSRGQMAELIQSGKVLRNWTEARATAQVEAGDMLTIRGTGRAKVVEIVGETKKDRMAIICEKY